ncbi:Imm63 family immunity protein [Agromyces mangrovi Wang et al. 2018]|uniref:Imm63 family immunity protein n=1 Tax=Agromyces mangrovi TaxID=1858653 RepID=UPI0025732620|nr:Imm63 family immunity protein [Agromyces mangrovi]BDZ66267.1 hypothetical protein GCM10025877_32050 [Agromyces mangrovi]
MSDEAAGAARLREALAAIAECYEQLHSLTGEQVAFRVGAENRDAGYPFIEADGSGYRYLAFERGRECLRQETPDLDELLYWVMEGEVLTFVKHREQRTRPHDYRGDTRRRWFPERISLLRALRPEWGERAERETERILATYPYRD